jgi:hypothetical protein
MPRMNECGALGGQREIVPIPREVSPDRGARRGDEVQKRNTKCPVRGLSVSDPRCAIADPRAAGIV